MSVVQTDMYITRNYEIKNMLLIENFFLYCHFYIVKLSMSIGESAKSVYQKYYCQHYGGVNK